jgi:hypothetical protein
MRGVKTWRSIRVRSLVLPLLLGALALRFLIPAGSMPGGDDGTTLQAALCSTEAGQSEFIEIPGEPAEPHCDHCLMPSLGPALAPFHIAGHPQIPQHSFLPQLESQIPDVPLARAQIPRGPPRA